MIEAPQGYQRGHNFPVRHGTKVEYMTVREIQEAFFASERWAERTNQFREDRIKNLEPMQRLARTPEGIGLVAHLIPFENLRQRVSLDLRHVHRQTFPMPVGVGRTAPTVSIFNANGLAVALPRSGAMQFFRDGKVELACGKSCFFSELDKNERVILNLVENSIWLFTTHISNLCTKAGIGFPFSISACLLNFNAHEAKPYDDDDRARRHGRAAVVLEEARVDLLDVLLEEGDDIATRLRPMFDILWQSFDYEMSPTYDPVTGAWRRAYQ
jgi:hypothetical protein